MGLLGTLEPSRADINAKVGTTAESRCRPIGASSQIHFPLPRFLGTLDFSSLARRAAVRFSAAAMDAFVARAERSSAVMVSRLRFPPILPPLRPISVMTWDIRSLFSMLHLRRIRTRVSTIAMQKIFSQFRKIVLAPKPLSVYAWVAR